MIIGIDIGGANLKLADSHGHCVSTSFAMWTEHERLGSAIVQLIQSFENQFNSPTPLTQLAVTMTGELADCFATRREGVASILQQVAVAVPESQTLVYSVGGQWLSPQAARLAPWRVAASNWYALADWLLNSSIYADLDINLVLDIGSTTIDVIPVSERTIATQARTDRQRLQLGQLLYTGMQRTPVAAVLNAVVLKSTTCPVMAERFATTDDAYLTLQLIEERHQDCDTADGRSRTKANAEARLARMIGEDLETLSNDAIESIAEQIVDKQAEQLIEALRRNLPSPQCSPSIVVSGHGRPLLERAIAKFQPDYNFLWLDDAVNPDAARCGPAMAVAWLCENQVSSEYCNP
jgi:(4-(4-[2-(gamma-L-glutamylamino)ethyl]phenoxymethyl)furan-2-yl)methanamine synthase